MGKVESAVPLYKQIVHDLVSRIKSGVYSEGDKLPTETELMEEYGVSRITVRSAIKELEDADIVERTRGKGTFVTTTRNAYAADDQESFTHSRKLLAFYRSARSCLDLSYASRRAFSSGPGGREYSSD